MVDDWAIEQFSEAELGDLRRTDRLIKMASSALVEPESGFSSMMAGEAENKGAYRFLSNESFTDEDILQPVYHCTTELLNQEPRVLLIQDSSHLNYDSKKKTYGMGHIGSNQRGSYQGILMHWTLALKASGEVLGAAQSKFWCREKKNKKKKTGDHQKIPIHKKESYKWIEAVEELEGAIGEKTQAIWVADREADIYDFMYKIQSINQDFVVRCNNDRVTLDGETLLKEQVRQSKVVGVQTLKIRRGNKESLIPVEIRCSEVELEAQRRKAGAQFTKQCGDLSICSVQVTSTDPTQPLEWILLTSLPAETLDECLETIWIYKQRWQIELVHKVLKSGFQAEELTLGHADRLKKALAILLPVSVQIYKMSHEAKDNPNEKSNKYLTKTECKIISKKHGKPITYIPTIKEAWLWISYLGGYRGSKNSKPAGSMIFWRGYKKLQQMGVGADLLMGG